MHGAPWTCVVLEEFIRLALLSEEDEKIIRTRAAGWSQVQQCIAFNMSSATLTRRIKRMKEKYDALVPFSDKLPRDLHF